MKNAELVDKLKSINTNVNAVCITFGIIMFIIAILSMIYDNYTITVLATCTYALVTIIWVIVTQTIEFLMIKYKDD